MKHYENSIVLQAKPEEIFNFADNHLNFASHMNKSSMMMGGGKMVTEVDDGKGQVVGSHIKMSGIVFGIKIFLDEVIIKHDSPNFKEWETVGDLKLLVIGHYRLGFEITPEDQNSKFRVFIDYDQPKSLGSKILGFLFGRIYAKWCVQNMISGVKKRFI
jgi:hypothetical protein